MSEYSLQTLDFTILGGNEIDVGIVFYFVK